MLLDAQNLNGSAGLEPAANAVKHDSPLTAGGLMEVRVIGFFAMAPKRSTVSTRNLHCKGSNKLRSFAGTEGRCGMDIYFYKADSLADAFDMASRDTTKWDFPAMGALAELAADTRRHLRKGMRMGMSTIWSSSRGQFNVFVDSKRGIGIGLLGLTGRESGIDDPAAAEILEYHRARPEVELYADPLVGFSEHIADINGLDAAYELLMRAGFLSRTDAIIEVTVGDEKVERPKFHLRGPWKPNEPRLAIGLGDGSHFVIDSDSPVDNFSSAGSCNIL